MSPALYFPVFIYSVLALCIFVGARFLFSSGYQMQEKGDRNFVIPLIICLIYIFFLGNRPPWSNYFGDTGNYFRAFMKIDLNHVEIDWHSEWVWEWLMVTVKSLGLDASTFFLIVEFGYIISVLLAIRIFTPDNILLCLLFVLSALMFYTFGINGIRNGLACHILLLGMAFLFLGNYTAGALLFLIAFGIHRSTMLPIAATLAALFVIKDPKWSIYFWMSSIVLSFFFGGWFINFFSGLGFDDRMTAYSTGQIDNLTRVGFRWDFLLYSAMPVLMGWYVCVKRKVSDNWYDALTTIYCLCNAFWVLVIRSSYSNRFAYLSWFIYPLIIAYPLIMLPVWDDQDQKTGIILFGSITFTIIMNYLWHNF